MELSIVSTLYRSAAHLDEFYRRMKAAAAAVTPDHEIVLVDDGSPDESLQIALRLQATDPTIRVIELSRNFGHHRAIMTGLAQARGRLVFLIDSDLEEEPELLGRFRDVLGREDLDVIYGVQDRRRGRLMDRVAGHLFFRLFNLLSDQKVPANPIVARLMRRQYVEALLQHKDREIFLAGLWAITGFRQRAVPVVKHRKPTTTYTLARKVDAFVASVTSFSNRPLLVVFYLGLAIVLAATAAAVYLIVRVIFFQTLLAGWPSLIISVWLLGGLTIFCLGLIGLYVSRIFSETKDRPYTIIRRIHEAERAQQP